MDPLPRALAALRSADALLITAGAGMGVDSGLPDFRGSEGFWRAYPPLRALGLRFEQMANPHWFARDPALAWGFYGHRHALCASTTPHAGYEILRGWVTASPARFARGHFVFTSNVDGHFARAGFAADRIVECHGSLQHLQCTRPSCAQPIWPASTDLGASLAVDPASLRVTRAAALPRCPSCGALARPNVLMFGDGSWLEDRTAAQERAFATWLDSLESTHSRSPKPRLVILELGAGTAVPTVRRCGETLAARFGATLLRINPDLPALPGDGANRDTAPGSSGISVPQSALAALQALAATWPTR